MAFTMIPTSDHFIAAAICDQCGARAGEDGLILWNLSGADANEADSQPCLIACSHACADQIASPYENVGDWVAIQLDAYLANLVHANDVDVEAVLERERAGSAAIHTRDESPE